MALSCRYYTTLVPGDLCLVLSLVLPLITGQTSPSVTPEATQAAENSTTVKVSTAAPTLPLLPQTEGQPDFYVYKKEKGKLVPCSRSTFIGHLAMSYTNTEGEVVTLDQDIPRGVNVEGECGDKSSNLVLHWGGTNYSAHYLNFSFLTKPPAGNDSQFSTWVLNSVSLTCNMDTDAFQDPLEGGLHSLQSDPTTSYFETPLGLSFACNSEESIVLEPVDNASQVLQSATLTLSGLQVQPFQLYGNGVFSKAGICDADLESADEVTGARHTAAIAIATILCIVIVVTLVTYYWVKRSHKPRYTSME